MCFFINQNSNHWCLFFIDLKKNDFYYIDPLGEDPENTKKFYNNWR